MSAEEKKTIKNQKKNRMRGKSEKLQLACLHEVCQSCKKSKYAEICRDHDQKNTHWFLRPKKTPFH